MRQLPFSFAVSGDTINSPVVRTVRGHVEQTCAVRDGLCDYRVNLWVNETDDTRHVQRTVKGVRYLETPLDVIAWVAGLYPEINTVDVPEQSLTDPVVALRKEIESPSQTWRAVFPNQVRVNDTILWMGSERIVKEINQKRGSVIVEFAFEDSSSYFKIHKSVQIMILVKENETL